MSQIRDHAILKVLPEHCGHWPTMIYKIVGYAVDIATGLKAVASAIGQAGSEVRMIANEITNTSDVLSNLGTVLKSQGRHQPDGCRTAARGLDICQPLLEEMEGLIHILSPLIERINHGRTRNFNLRLRWLLEKSKFALHMQSLERLKLSLTLSIITMNWVESSRNQESNDILQTLSRQLEHALANVAPLVHPVFPINISGSFRASEQTQPRLPESREYDNNRFDIPRRIATLDLSSDQEDAVPPYNFDGYSSAETVELPVQETSTSVARRTALGETSNAESLGDWDIGGEREALNLHFKATNFTQDAINSTNAALNGLSAGPGLAAVAPRFAWVCSTVLDYSLACLMLDKEIVLDEDTESAHDASFTFGQIDRKDIVIIYHPFESENTPEYSGSEKYLQNLLKRRFDSVKLVLVVGVGGVMPDLCPKFDVRLGDIVVSQTFAKDLDSRLTAMCKFRGQASWLVLQAVAKLESQQLMGTGSRWYDGWPKRLPSSAQVKFIQPGHDLLFSRSYKHVHYEPRPSCGNCSNTGIVRRRERNLKTPVVHVGNTFVTKDDFGIAENMRSHPTMKEWTAKPLVFTKNGATVVATFPCIIICGVSNYCDTHDQSYWGDYAAFKAAQYAKKLVSVL